MAALTTRNPRIAQSVSSVFATHQVRNAAVVNSAAAWDSARPYDALPGPKPIPVLGNVWRFLPVIGDLSKYNGKELLPALIEKYGSIVKFGGFGKPDLVILGDPDSAEIMMRTEGEWPIREGLDVVEYYFSKRKDRENSEIFAYSLGVTQGKEWGDFRSAINPVMMQPKNTKMYVKPIGEVADEFLNRIYNMRDAKLELPETFLAELSRWALESVMYVALDARLGTLRSDLTPDSEPMRVIQAANDVFETIYKLDFRPSPWKYVSTPNFRKFMKSMDYFKEITGKHVSRAMKNLQALTPEEIANRDCSVLEKLLLRTNDPLKAVGMAMDMLLGGIETSSMLVAVVMYHLAIHPEKQRKLQEELDTVIPDPHKELTSQQLDQMKYLKACIKESMRLEPVAVLNARTTAQDLVLHGYRIPKGTRLLAMHSVMMQQESNFPRAKEFIPERWLRGEETLKAKHPFAYMPFGFGPRMCAGRRFAELEIEVLLSKMFRNFNWEWHYPPPKADVHLIASYQSPLKFTMKDRSQSN